MKVVALALAASLLGGAAYAETVVIKERGTVVEDRVPDTTVIEKRTDRTGALGCSTKSVTRTNEDGDTTTKTRTDC